MIKRQVVCWDCDKLFPATENSGRVKGALTLDGYETGICNDCLRKEKKEKFKVINGGND